MIFIPTIPAFETHDLTYAEDYPSNDSAFSNDTFTAPVTGLYFFEANIYANVDIRYIYLMKKSASGAFAEIVPGSPFGIPRGEADAGGSGTETRSSSKTSAGCWHLKLNKGDSIGVGAYGTD